MPKILKTTFTVARTLCVAVCCLLVCGSPKVGLAQNELSQAVQDKQEADNQAKEKPAAETAEPKTAEPKTAEPKAAEPKAAEPKTAELKTAQSETAQPGKEIGVTFSNAVQSKWKVGTKIIGGSKAASNVLITLPVPADWPEQSVSFDDVVVDSQSRVLDSFRKLDGGIHQLVVKMPRLAAREQVVVSVTCLVTTSQIDAPADPSVLLKPKTSHREGKPYTGVGPDINFRNAKLRAQVKQLVKDKPSVWAEVESIFDWVRDEIEDTTQEPGDVVSVFRHRQGCNEDKVGLFVAMCRAHKVPARMVWVQGTQHAEFMLVDSDKKAHWIPCRPGGLREFGSIAEPRVVLQKGDSIRVPEKEQRQKYVAEFVTCEGLTAASKPRVGFFRELVSDE